MDQQKEVLFTVGGMHCAACSSRLERVLNGMDGVQSATVSLAANSATVVPDPALSESDTEALVHQIEERAVDMGFTATPVAPEADMVDTWEAQQKETVGQLATLKARLWPEFGFTILLLLVSMGHMWGLPLPAIIDPMHSPESALNHALLQLVLTLPVLWSGRHFYLIGLPNLWRLTPNMDSLVAMGTGAAFLYSLWNTVEVALGHTGKVMDLYYESAAVLISLISLGKYLEAVSRFRMSDAIGALMNLTPETALRLPAPDKADQAEEVPVKVVRVGDYLQVKPGGRIPVDGVVTNGASSVDASMLTGESMPVPVGVGSSVAGGTMNTTGSFIMRAERVGADTALSRIIKLVREAQSSKAPIARLADDVSLIFVPTVMALAVIAGAGWLYWGHVPVSEAFRIFVAVLVVACPCALGLATPVAIMVGSGMGAKNGILFKTAASLEETGRIQIVALDKTGTITSGDPTVTDLCPAPGVTEGELLRLACALERRSEHPLAKAVLRRAEADGLTAAEVADFQALPGNGLKATLDGQPLCGGNADFIRTAADIPAPMQAQAQTLAEAGKTPLFFARGGQLLGIIAVADVLKPDSPQAIRELRNMGIRVVMITGDNARTAKAIGAQAGVDEVIAGVLPDGKEREIRRLSARGKVAMVGDGINDAPALTRADIGIAIGAGTDVAIDAADVVLVNSRLSDVPAAIRLSRATLRNIHENLFWAFFYNTIGIPIAAGVFVPLGLTLNPMFGAAAMSLSSFCVVTNALRLNLFKLRDTRHDHKRANHLKETTEIKEETTMKKTISIEGMMCGHCEAAVKKALEALPEVTEAAVSHTAGTAVVTLSAPVDDAVLKAAVEAKDYTVTGIA